MLAEQKEILVDYLDNQLEAAERLKAEQLLREDATAVAALQELEFSVALVREAAVLEQVKAARHEFYAGAKVVPMEKKQAGAVVRSFSKNVLRVAAMVVLVAGAASVYKYSVTDGSSVFEKNYTSFELSTSRGQNDDGSLEQAYRNKDWKKVMDAARNGTGTSTKANFLAGMAAMETKEYNNAVSYFKQVLQINAHATAPLFQDEAEYYLAMADLAANQPAEGIAILKKIRADKDHLFYKKANRISSLDVKLLELKK